MVSRVKWRGISSMETSWGERRRRGLCGYLLGVVGGLDVHGECF